MASKINHSFKHGALALIKGGWANRVARVCSYWIGRNGIDVLIPENPSGNSPCSVALNVKNATKLIVNEIQTGLGLILDRAHPLELRTVDTTNESTGAVSLSYSMIYLPSLTLNFSGTDYTVTGLTALGNGWYNTGRSTGDFWLVEGETANQLTLSNEKTSAKGKLSFFVGSIGANNPWTVTQYAKAAGGYPVVTDEAKVSQEFNTPKIDTTHSTIPDLTALFPSSKRAKDPEDWEIGDLVGGTGSDKNKAAGVRFTVITRIVPDGTGSLYCYSRTLTFSNAGILVEVSAENGGVAISEG